jgi:hypothetical protein
MLSDRCSRIVLQITSQIAPTAIKTKNSRKNHPRTGMISRKVVMRVPKKSGQKKAVARDFLK